MHIISDSSCCSQQLAPFARHTTALMNDYPTIFPLIWIRNKHFLILTADKTQDSRVFKGSTLLDLDSAA